MKMASSSGRPATISPIAASAHNQQNVSKPRTGLETPTPGASAGNLWRGGAEPDVVGLDPRPATQ
jgi:hypothetical protein